MDIKEKLFALGYKIDFWYEEGKLDAICIARREGSDLNHKKTYSIEEISDILFSDFISNLKRKPLEAQDEK